MKGSNLIAIIALVLGAVALVLSVVALTGDDDVDTDDGSASAAAAAADAAARAEASAGSAAAAAAGAENAASSVQREIAGASSQFLEAADGIAAAAEGAEAAAGAAGAAAAGAQSAAGAAAGAAGEAAGSAGAAAESADDAAGAVDAVEAAAGAAASSASEAARAAAASASSASDAAAALDAPPGKDNPNAYAVWLVNEAIARVNDEGLTATLAHYNSSDSVDGQWYTAVIDSESGVLLGHYDDDVRGRSIKDALGTDVTGYRFGEAMLDVGEDEYGRWVTYVFLNPATGLGQEKHSWVARRDGLLYVSGWYEHASLPADELLTKENDPAGYTQKFVQEAVDVYEAGGFEALHAYNDVENNDLPWYIYVIDATTDLVVVHPFPEVVGVSVLGGLSTRGPVGYSLAGNYFGPDLMAVPEEGGWVSYRSPSGAGCDVKRSWAVRRDNYVIGSGWYEPVGTHPLLPSKCDSALYTVSTVELAVDRYRVTGREATIAYYSDPDHVDERWFVVMIDAETGEVLAHPDASVIGKNAHTHPKGYDDSGHHHVPGLMAATSDGVFLEAYLNIPTEGEETPFHRFESIEEVKRYYAVLEDGIIFASGSYELAPSKADPEGYARLLVARVLTMVEEEGVEATLDYLNSPESLDGPWYVFAIEDRDGVLYSAGNANRPDIVGTTRERIDSTGFNYGEAFAAVTEEGGGGWVSYLFTHPQTREDARKDTWTVRHGDYLFGAGWYEGIE